MRRLPLKAVLPLAVLAGAAVLFVSLRATRPEPPPARAEERTWTVAAVPAVRHDLQPRLTLYGEVVAGRSAELRPLVSGRIASVASDFVDGAAVQAGERLLAIDPFDFEAQVAERQAELEEARARVSELQRQLEGEHRQLETLERQAELTRADVERKRLLFKRGTVSRKAYDDVLSALAERQQQVAARRQTIAQLKTRLEQTRAQVARLEVALRRARHDLQQTRLNAPFSGFLAETSAAIGRQVSTSDQVAVLIDAARLEVRFHVGESAFARLLDSGGYEGREVTVRWRTGGHVQEFAAEIERSQSRIETQSGGVMLFARLKDIGLDTVLRPGAFVEVSVPDRHYDDVIRLPQGALHDGEHIYVVDADGRLEVRQASLVGRIGGEVLVRSAIAEDRQIVVTRFPQIGPGVKVEVRRP